MKVNNTEIVQLVKYDNLCPMCKYFMRDAEEEICKECKVNFEFNAEVEEC